MSQSHLKQNLLGFLRKQPNADGVYELANAKDLVWFAKKVNSENAGKLNAKLMADIQMEEGELYCPMIDARRMEVYMALYDQALGEVKAPSAVVVDEQWLESLLADKVVYFFGDGADKCKDLLTKYPNARYVKDVRVMARDMLALSIQAFNRGKFADTAYFTPFYLKEFEASKPKDLLSSLSNPS